MTDVGDDMVAFWDDLVAETGKVSGLEVYQGRFWPPKSFPAAFVELGPIVQTARDSSGGTYYDFSYFIYLFADRKGDIRATVKEAVDLMGKIIAELIDDRTLGGTCDKLEDGPIRPSPPGVPAGFERQAILMEVKISKWIP